MNKIIRLVCLTALLTLNLLFVVALSAQDAPPSPDIWAPSPSARSMTSSTASSQ
ncbi:MAG: hypothetical protein IPO91_22370 [Chloroflexi bacterium]|nr:hypothetical protein [Chloroflexota bacterium]